jgi:hypothetical protein
MELNFQEMSMGKFNAAGMSTTYVTMKTDSTNEWEMKGILTTNEGDFIAVMGKGTGESTGPTTSSWEGEVHFMTQSPRLAWLNNIRGWSERVGGVSKGESHGKIYQQ